MTGTLDSLISRAARVTEGAMKSLFWGDEDVSGVLLTYCAGCMLSVGDDMEHVARGLRDVLTGAPFLGSFTFGEQGCFAGGENRHDNVMISAVVLGR